MSETLRIELDPGNPPNLNAPPPPAPTAGRELPPPPRAAQTGTTGALEDEARRRQQLETDRMAEIRRASSSRQQVEAEYRLRQQREAELSQKIKETRERLASEGMGKIERDMMEAMLAAMVEAQQIASRELQEDAARLRSPAPAQQPVAPPRVASIPAPIFTTPQQQKLASQSPVGPVEPPTVPAIKIPAPEVEVPQASKVQIPSPELFPPTVPPVTIPSPKIETPAAGTVRVPAPEVETPTVPPVEIPAPQVNTPTVPPVNIAAPSVNVPTVPPVEIPAPEVRSPKIPPPAQQPVQAPAAATMPAPTPPPIFNQHRDKRLRDEQADREGLPRYVEPRTGSTIVVPATKVPEPAIPPSIPAPPVDDERRALVNRQFPNAFPQPTAPEPVSAPKPANTPPTAPTAGLEPPKQPSSNVLSLPPVIEQVRKEIAPGFDPEAEARRQMEMEREAKAKAEQVDRARREIDAEYGLRKNREEQFAREREERAKRSLDPEYRVRQQMEREQRDKRDRDEMDSIRKKIDPQYKTAREREERQSLNERRGNVTERLGMVNQTVGAAGQVAAGVAAGDPSATFDGVLRGANVASTALMGIAPIAGAVGLALTGMASAAKGVYDGLQRTADRLAPFSAQLTVAQVQADIRQLMTDMRKAQQLGPELAKFVEQSSKAREKYDDAVTRLQLKLLPIATELIEILTGILNFFAGLGAKEMPEKIGKVATGIFGGGLSLTKYLADMGNNLKKVADNTKKDDSNINEFQILADIIDAQIKAGQQVEPGMRGGGMLGGNLLKMPIMEGL